MQLLKLDSIFSKTQTSVYFVYFSKQNRIQNLPNRKLLKVSLRSYRTLSPFLLLSDTVVKVIIFFIPLIYEPEIRCLVFCFFPWNLSLITHDKKQNKSKKFATRIM